MGKADVILGIRIKRESNEISISQSYYIEKVLKKFNYFDYTPLSTPMDTCEKLRPNTGQTVSQLEHLKLLVARSTLAKAYNQMYNRKSRHLGVRHRMIHELIMNEGWLKVHLVTEHQDTQFPHKETEELNSMWKGECSED
ncbi:hypothetical protein Tco_0448754 [Tanacetum coccineum]